MHMASNGVLLRVKRSFLSSYNYRKFRPSLSSAPYFYFTLQRRENFQASHAAAESTVGGNNSGAPDPTRQERILDKAKHEVEDEDQSSGLTGYAAEMMKNGAEMAKDVTDKVGETAKRTVDGVWKGSVAAMEQMKEVTGGGEEEKRGPNYRMDGRDDRGRTVEDLRRRAGGYDIDTRTTK